MSGGQADPNIALCLEQTLGHRAHTLTLVDAAQHYGRAAVDVFKVDYTDGRFPKTPWALRGSYAALGALRRSGKRFDAALFHTQTISLLAPFAPARRYVVSVDATPTQMDMLGEGYGHHVGRAPAEALKRRWYARVFGGASLLIAWSDWAACSLMADYAVSPEKVRVLHPGAPAAFFGIERPSSYPQRPSILFVGGDFPRKGGPQLLEAFRRLKPRADLTLVTTAHVPAEEGLRVIADASPGSPGLLRAFAEADIFCLPTLADCTSLAIGEAMAAGLPVVTTTVGSNRATAPDGEAGILVQPGDVASLYTALDRLIADPGLRLDMGRRARERARRQMQAAVNASTLLDFVRGVCAEGDAPLGMELAG